MTPAEARALRPGARFRYLGLVHTLAYLEYREEEHTWWLVRAQGDLAFLTSQCDLLPSAARTPMVLKKTAQGVAPSMMLGYTSISGGPGRQPGPQKEEETAMTTTTTSTLEVPAKSKRVRKPKAPGAKGGPKAIDPATPVTLLVAENPHKRATSRDYKSFAKLEALAAGDHRTVGAALAAGVSREYLTYSRSKGWLKF